MAFNREHYKRLAKSSSDLICDVQEIEVKDKPILRRPFLLRSRIIRRYLSRVCRPFNLLLILLSSLAIQLIFNGSYQDRDAPAFEHNKEERVFIAANIVDGDLISNAWGSSIISLVELIGPERVFVSIYGAPTNALSRLAEMLNCEHKIISEENDPIHLDRFPRTLLPDGTRRIKRIAFLAEVRNKALEPLEELEKQGKKFQKILFINDVYFSPSEATRLLWGTNVNANGKTEYKAACAVDFVNSWKYYDTFATRDTEGFSLGIPIFPWFSSMGDAVSRKDVLAGRDSVRVKSCWGGMVSFDARYFMKDYAHIATNKSNNNPKAISSPSRDEISTFPVRFRSETEPFWDSSECCLVHADLIALPSFYTPSSAASKYDTGIYLNPYVRTAYSARTFAWIPFAKRFERLLTPIQGLFNPLVNLPRYNYRRTEVSDQKFNDSMWVSHNNTHEKNITNNDVLKSHRFPPPENFSRTKEFWLQYGFYTNIQRVATRGGYCGVRQLMVLKEKAFPLENNGKGGQNWDNLFMMVPPFSL